MKIDYARNDKLTDFAKAVLNDQIVLPGEDPQEAFARAATAFSGGDKALAQRLYDYASNLWFTFATPIIANGGTGRGLPISCFLNYVDDSIRGLADNLVENAFLATNGGGIGSYWGHVRSVGETTSKGIETPGLMPFLHVADAQMLAYHQGKTRRGQVAAYIDVSHPEILEFIEMRSPTGGDVNRKNLNSHHGINITDRFMHAVVNDDDFDLIDPHSKRVVETVKARKIWIRILQARVKHGEPYLFFIDTANEALPLAQKKKGLKVWHSNLCVAPETKILTKDGYFDIASLEGKKVEVWNGDEWSETIVHKTGENQKLLKVTFSDGSVIECTPYHKFYVKNLYHVKANEKRASELKIGDKLEKWNLPVIESGEKIDYPYINGFFSGDGTYTRDNFPGIWLYGVKRKLANDLIIDKQCTYHQYADRDTLRYKKGLLKEKFYVPINGDLETKLEWLSGISDSDGTIANVDQNKQLQICSTNLQFLNDIRLMLSSIGIHSKVRKAKDSGFNELPDGKGGSKQYFCETCYRLLITSCDLYKLVGLGFNPKRLVVGQPKPQRDARQFISVVSVEDHGRVSDTFCFTETKKGKGIFNGVLTGNCSEITLPTSTDRTAVCCLSSINVAKIDEWIDVAEQFVADLTTMLDNVLEVFIETAPPELWRAVNSAKKERAIGLGQLGLGSLFQQKGLAFESNGARALNEQIASMISKYAIKQSRKLAEIRGEPEDMVGTGLRNSHLIAIAPNATSSIIAGVSPSIEPWVANCFAHKTKTGTFFVKNMELEKVLEAYYRNDKETWDSINIEHGSVQHLDFLTDGEKELFKTAAEIDQVAIVTLAADRAPWICQSQSLNLFMPANVNAKYLSDIHILAWKSKVKGLYYLRSTAIRKTNLGKVEISDECVACHA